jgi:hypothetical protein
MFVLGFVQETGYINFSMLLYVFINAVITLINLILIHLFKKLTLDIRINFSCLWSVFIFTNGEYIIILG